VRLVAIGLLAGLFSALFGVGGGIVAVPLLILAAGLEPRSAAATSLGMIGITALAGVVGYAIGGHVEVGYAALVGIPAAFGAVAGASLQQRVHARTLTYLFSALLVAIAVRLLAT